MRKKKSWHIHIKNLFAKTAYLLYGNVLIKGYKTILGFQPSKSVVVGFRCRRIKKSDIGTKLFYSVEVALKELGSVELAGCNIAIATDKGHYKTRLVCMVEDHVSFHQEKTEDVDISIYDYVDKCLKSIGIRETHNCVFNYAHYHGGKSLVSGETELSQ